MEIQPFSMELPEAMRQDLRERLARTRWPGEVEGAGWRLGVPTASLRELTEEWRTRFDWRRAEARIRSVPQFTAGIDGARVHFAHARGEGPRPFPIVITHGWPGSFLEMLRIVPLLTNPSAHGGDPADAFDVVVPSIPGFGFSEPSARLGMGPARVARIWAELMAGLGYERFGAQGGDWGATVATRLAMEEPSRVAGIHLNYIPGSYAPDLGAESRPLSGAEREFLDERERWREDEGAYGHIQATRPQTLAYALTDSPVGLLAWIVEKLRSWSDCGGDVESRFSREEILTHVTLYWLTGTIGSSIRLYAEARESPLRFPPGARVPGPTGVARFPKEAPMPPRDWVERAYDVARWTEMPRGGHFAAMEEPELLAEDVREFFRPLRGTAGG